MELREGGTVGAGSQLERVGVADRPLARRSIVVIVALVVMVPVAAAVVIVGSRGTPSYPDGSPEAALQRFLEAEADGDPEAAYDLLSSNVRARVSSTEYRRAWDWARWFRETDRRMVLERMDQSGAYAFATVRIETYTTGDPFGSSTHSFDRSIRLVREAPGWRVDEALVGVDRIAGH